MTCDYNGWTDAPEEERERLDQHAEVWTALNRDTELRPIRATLRNPVTRLRGGIAA